MKRNNAWFIAFWLTLFIIIIALMNSAKQKNQVEELKYSQFKENLRGGNVAQVVVSPGMIKGRFRNSQGELKQFKTVPMNDPDLIKDLEANKVMEFSGVEQNGWLGPLLMSWGPYNTFDTFLDMDYARHGKRRKTGHGFRQNQSQTCRHGNNEYNF